MPPTFKLITVPHHIIAGHLQFFINNWKILTKETWIHNTIQGFHIPLDSPPKQTSSWEWTLLKDNKEALNQELHKLLERDIITPVTVNNLSVFISPIFMIPKKSGEQRLIINLKKLNKFVKKQRFKMERAHLLRDLLIKDDWMVKIDLKEAYYAVPIHQDSQSLLSFLWDDKPFKFTCLPFGLSCAPRVFTKVLKPVVAYLREKGIRLIIYINNILIMARSKQIALDYLYLTLNILEILGFLVNYPKCILRPTQIIDFLGFW